MESEKKLFYFNDKEDSIETLLKKLEENESVVNVVFTFNQLNQIYEEADYLRNRIIELESENKHLLDLQKGMDEMYAELETKYIKLENEKKEKNRKYYMNHKQKEKNRVREWEKLNPEKRKEYTKKYYSSEQGKMKKREQNRKYRERQKQRRSA